MASTYTTNTGIELIATGEQSGTWGDTTNTNLEIIDRLTNGVGSISLSGTTHTLTTTDGALSDGQFAVLVFGGSPSGTNTVTISPNDQAKVYIVKNNSGESVLLTQGSGGNVTVEDGNSAIVYADGAGAGAEIVDVTSTFVPSSALLAANNLSDLANAGTARTNLGVAIGTDVLAYDSNLQSFVTTFTLPTTDGSNGQVLTTNGSGTLSFEDGGGGGGSGDVVGPASATDNGIALFDGTTGKLLQNSSGQDGLIHGITVGRGASSLSNNTVFGGNAGSSITSGDGNTFIGKSAGSSVTSGGNNVAVGTTAFTASSGSTGDENVAIGSQALVFGTTGDRNIAIGRQSMISSSLSGNANVAVGNLALQNLTSGSNNIGIGASAGTSSSPFTITSQSSRIVLGDSSISNAYIQVAWTVTSDARDKTDVVPIENGLDLVTQLNPVTFKWDKRSSYWVKDEDGNILEKPDPDGTHKEDQPFAGFLAQEVQEAVDATGFTDDIIVDKEQDDLWKIKETALIPVLVKAVQELKARVEELESRG